jgi:hypothetical protein
MPFCSSAAVNVERQHYHPVPTTAFTAFAAAAAAVVAKPEREGCIVDTYEQLYNVTEDYSKCGGGGDDAHIFLSCNTRWFRRGSLPLLHIEHDALESSSHEPSVHILPESECGVITIEVDLEQNPELPLLTVHGDLGIHKVGTMCAGYKASAMLLLPVVTLGLVWRGCKSVHAFCHDAESKHTLAGVVSAVPLMLQQKWQQYWQIRASLLVQQSDLGITTRVMFPVSCCCTSKYSLLLLLLLLLLLRSVAHWRLLPDQVPATLLACYSIYNLHSSSNRAGPQPAFALFCT